MTNPRRTDPATTDEALLAAYVAGGDGASFERLSRRVVPFVYNVAFRLTSNREEAEDVTQEALVLLHAHAARFDPSMSLRAWMYRITARLCLKTHRARRRRSRREEAYARETARAKRAGDRPPGRATSANAADAWPEVERLLGGLPLRLRTPIVLSFFEGLSYREIAKILGCSLGSVSNRIGAGLRDLRHGLAGSSVVVGAVSIEAVLRWAAPRVHPADPVAVLASASNAGGSTAAGSTISPASSTSWKAALAAPEGGLTVMTIGITGTATAMAAAAICLVIALDSGAGESDEAAGTRTVAAVSTDEDPRLTATSQPPDEPAPPASTEDPKPTPSSNGAAPVAPPDEPQTPAKDSASIRGVVRDHLGNPVGGAKVRIWPPGKLASQETIETVTDDNGMYVFQDVPPGRTWTLAATLRDHAEYRQKLGRIEPGRLQNVDVALHQSYGVRLRLHDVEMDPLRVDSAYVMVRSKKLGGNAYGFRTKIHRRAAGATGVSDKSGKVAEVEIASIDPQEYPVDEVSIMITVEGYSPATIDGLSELTWADDQWLTADVFLHHGVPVWGGVVDEHGRPLEGAHVWIAPTRRWVAYRNRHRTTTDANGQFSMSNLAEDGTYRVDIIKDDLVLRTPITFDHETGQTNNCLKMRLFPGRVIEGTVIDRDGRPIDGITLGTGANLGPSQDDPWVRKSHTDDNGRFRIDGLPLSSRNMYLTLDDEIGGIVEQQILEQSPRRLEVRFVCDRYVAPKGPVQRMMAQASLEFPADEDGD